MSHGFSRFGTPSARERFHAQARRGGSFTLFLPTILATLFLFTAVIALNKLTGMSKGKTVRLINVDDVFPTPESVEQNRKKEFWETPPPPSPESVIARPELTPPQFVEQPAGTSVIVDGPGSLKPSPRVPAPARPLPVIDTAIPMPTVKPDTSLPEPVKP